MLNELVSLVWDHISLECSIEWQLSYSYKHYFMTIPFFVHYSAAVEQVNDVASLVNGTISVFASNSTNSTTEEKIQV